MSVFFHDLIICCLFFIKISFFLFFNKIWCFFKYLFSGVDNFYYCSRDYLNVTLFFNFEQSFIVGVLFLFLLSLFSVMFFIIFYFFSYNGELLKSYVVGSLVLVKNIFFCYFLLILLLFEFVLYSYVSFNFEFFLIDFLSDGNVVLISITYWGFLKQFLLVLMILIIFFLFWINIEKQFKMEELLLFSFLVISIPFFFFFNDFFTNFFFIEFINFCFYGLFCFGLRGVVGFIKYKQFLLKFLICSIFSTLVSFAGLFFLESFLLESDILLIKLKLETITFFYLNFLNYMNFNIMYWFLNISIVFFFIGFLFKIGMFPFFFWMYSFYRFSDNRLLVSYLIGSTFFQFFMYFFKFGFLIDFSSTLRFCFIICGLLTIGGGIFNCFLSTTVRDIFLFSSIINNGLCLVLRGALPIEFTSLILYYLFIYSINLSVVLFFFTFFFYKKFNRNIFGSLSYENLKNFSGYHTVNGVIIMITLFSFLLLMGFPPFFSFFVKFTFFYSIFIFKYHIILGFFIVISVAVMYLYLLIVKKSFFYSKRLVGFFYFNTFFFYKWYGYIFFFFIYNILFIMSTKMLLQLFFIFLLN